jgi:transducin (beta)-like 1
MLTLMTQDGSIVKCVAPYHLLTSHECEILEDEEEEELLESVELSVKPQPPSSVKRIKSSETFKSHGEANTSLEENPKATQEEDLGEQDMPMQDVESSVEFLENEISTLSGHTSEVFVCAWNPIEPLLATG